MYVPRYPVYNFDQLPIVPLTVVGNEEQLGRREDDDADSHLDEIMEKVDKWSQ